MDADNEFTKCACNGSFLDKLLQPALLTLLSAEPSYGFRMLSDLEHNGMVPGDSLDPAGLYRTLKRMEGAGLVRAFWETENCAKPRRIYSITDQGLICLENWHRTLLEYRNNLDTILCGIERRGLTQPSTQQPRRQPEQDDTDENLIVQGALP